MASSLFHRDSVVLFDAFGTVIRPVHGIIETYHDHGQRFGSQLNYDEIKSSFAAARQEVFGVGVEADRQPSLPSSDKRERELWAQLIARVFTDVEDTLPLLNGLWDFFAAPKNWTVYDDVVPCFDYLAEAQFEIGIASNFDSRLLPIVESQPALQNVVWTFCSSRVGYRKPDARFYSTIVKEVESSRDQSVLPKYFMVGDDVINDVISPTRFGWTTFHIDRKSEVGSSFRSLVDIAGVMRIINQSAS